MSDPVDDFLNRGSPPAGNEHFQAALLRQTTRLLRRRQRLRQLAYLGALAACFLAGMATMHWLTPPAPAEPTPAPPVAAPLWGSGVRRCVPNSRGVVDRERSGVGDVVEQTRPGHPLRSPAERHSHEAVDVGLLLLDRGPQLGNHREEFLVHPPQVRGLRPEVIEFGGRCALAVERRQ